MRLAVGLILTLLASVPAQAQLSGTYTIGGTSPDYATIPAAVTALTSQGVSGNVIFQIRPGTYDYSTGIEIGAISGVSVSAQVRFEASNPSNRPVLQRTNATSTATNFVVRLDGADWVTLKNLDFVATAIAPYGRLLVLDGDPLSLTIRGSSFSGHAAPGSDEGSLVLGITTQLDDATIDQNTFEGGWRGLDLSPAGGGGLTSDASMTNNSFGAQEKGGIEFNGDGRVEGNTIVDGAFSESLYRAIGVSGGQASAMEVVGNTIDVATGRSGIVGNAGTTLIANNRISIRRLGTDGSGIYATGGLVAHNTVHVLDINTALLLSAGGNMTEVRNNILIVDGPGAAIEDLNINSIIASDDNLLYSTSGALVEWESATYTTLAAWQAASGFDASSVSKTVSFVSTGATPDLHLAGASLNDIDLIASPIAGYPQHSAVLAIDADGDFRSPFNPTMGSDEGTSMPPLDNADVAAGFYTVGGTTPDFPDAQTALDALAERGMKGAVTLRIRAGAYPLRRVLNPSIRVGPAEPNPATAPLEIRAANPANHPVLQSGATASFNWILKLNGVDHVTLTNLDFDASGAGDNGRVLVLGGTTSGTDDLTVTNCTFTGAALGTASDARVLLFSDVDGHDDLTVTGSTFTNGWAGLYFNDGGGGVRDTGVVVSGNTFGGQSYRGLQAQFDEGLITGNTFSSSHSGTAIFLWFVHGYTITGNQISYTNVDSDGITLLQGVATPTAPGLIANNFVRAEAPLLLRTGATVTQVIHNTFYASGTNPLAISAYTSSDFIADLTNNVLYNADDGPVLRLSTLASIGESNRNVMHTVAGPALIQIGTTTYATLADWQAASGLDAHSRSFNPSFQNAAQGDLHLAGASIGDPRFAGQPGTGILVDIDGATRNPSNPYVGADEAATPLLPLDGIYFVGSEPSSPTADFATFAEAIEALDLLGVSAPVTMRLFADPAPLAGPFTIRAIDGATATNRVTVISYLPINTLTNAATQPSNNWVVKLDGARHVTFSNIAFDASDGTAPLGRAILFTGDVQDVRFENAFFHGIPGATDPLASVIWTDGATLTDVVFDFGAVNDGSHGIALNAPGSTGTIVRDLNVNGQTKDGVTLTGHVDPVVRRVTIASGATVGSATGVRLADGTGGDVARSMVTMTGGFGTGVTVDGQNGAPGVPVRVVNNFLTTATNGVVLLGADEVLVAHNSVSSSGGSGALFMNGSTSVRIANNLLTSTAGGRLLNLDGTAGITGSDYNGLVTSGAVVSSVGATSYPTLAAYTTATGLDAQSNTPSVVFANATTGDLHLSGASVGNASLGAPPLGSVAVDIDGAARSATFTYKGADEAATPLALGVSFSVQAFLQGALGTGPGTPMRTDLKASGAVPLSQPYAHPRFNGTPMNYDGSESVGVVPANVVDWMIVELRQNPSGPPVAQAAVFLDEDGFARMHTGGTTLSFPALLPGVYNVVVKHRNHLALMSIAKDLSFAQTVPFQDPSGVVGGTAAGVQVGGLLTMAAGDGDADGSVLAGDRQAVWLPQVGQSGYLQGDFNMDGNVLADDRQSLWAPNVGRQSNVPGASLTEGTPTETHVAGVKPVEADL